MTNCSWAAGSQEPGGAAGGQAAAPGGSKAMVKAELADRGHGGGDARTGAGGKAGTGSVAVRAAGRPALPERRHGAPGLGGPLTRECSGCGRGPLPGGAEVAWSPARALPSSSETSWMEGSGTE